MVRTKFVQSKRSIISTHLMLLVRTTTYISTLTKKGIINTWPKKGLVIQQCVIITEKTHNRRVAFAIAYPGYPFPKLHFSLTQHTPHTTRHMWPHLPYLIPKRTNGDNNLGPLFGTPSLPSLTRTLQEGPLITGNNWGLIPLTCKSLWTRNFVD